MKKLVKSSLVVIASLGLFGCSGKSNSTTSTSVPTSTPASTTPASTTPTSTAPVTHTLAFDVEGTLKVGETLKVNNVTFDNETLVPDELKNLTVTVSDTTAFDINGRNLKCLKDGTFTITATYSGTTASKEVTIEKGITYSTVAEVRALAENSKYKEVYVKGVVTAAAGSTGYLEDSTGSIYVYGYYFNKTDTACTNYSWVVGTTVEVHCFVTAYNGAPQLVSSYKENNSYVYVDDNHGFANLSTDTINPSAVTTITETELKALTVADTGKMFKFVATYQSGTIDSNSKSYLSFKVGDTSIQLATNGSYDKKIADLITAFEALGLEEGDEVEITAPFNAVASSKYAATFSYLSQGTSITRHYEQDTLYAKYTGEEKVGNTLTFTASYNGNTVTPTLTATTGSDLVTIDGTSVTLNKVGDVVIEVSYMDGETKKTKEISFTIASADPVAINTITATGDYLINGVVSSTCTKGFTVTDSTATIYVHMNAIPTVAVGDSVAIEGTVSTYNGAFQFAKPTVTKLENALSITVPEAVELTSTIADSLVKTSVAVTDIVKYKWTTTVAKSSNYYTLNVNGSTTTIEPSYYSGTLEVGTTYEIEAYYLGYNSKNSYASVLITNVKEKAPTEVSVKLNKTTESVEMGKTVTLTATVKLPENVTDNSVTWTSSDDTVATVADGVVTGVKVGTTTITATSVADNTKSASCVVTVEEAIAGTSVTLTFDSTFNSDFTTISTTEVVKTTSDVTMTWLKNNSSNTIAIKDNALQYVDPIRLYTSHTVKFDVGTKKIAKITTKSVTKYLFNSTNISSDNGTVGDDTVTFDTTVGNVTFTIKNQVRLNSITFVLVD